MYLKKFRLILYQNLANEMLHISDPDTNNIVKFGITTIFIPWN